MPSFPAKAKMSITTSSAGLCLAIAMLLLPSAFAADTNDQQAYCNYITQQATAQRDLLMAPNAVAGVTQPNTGLPMQVVWGISGSLSGVRKAMLTMDVARKNCELYGASASAQQDVQYALPSLEKKALQHRLGLIQQASEKLEELVNTTREMLETQNMTRP